MIREKIAKVENQMREALAEVRETFKHSGNKGTNTEYIFRDFVRQYLPRRLEIGNGEIIDSFGNRSGQADIVIVNEDHPFTFTSSKPGLFFIEGILSVGEVKTTLTTQELKNTLKSSLCYKKLKMKHGKGEMVHANESDLKRYYEHPPFFLFCYESQLKLSTIKTKIEDFIKENSLEATETIDGIFLIDKGWLINFGDGKGAFKFRTPDGKNLDGWIIKESDSVLFDFLSYISVTMLKIIRFEPILLNYLFSKEQ